MQLVRPLVRRDSTAPSPQGTGSTGLFSQVGPFGPCAIAPIVIVMG
jgi:hypothetical protein